MQFPMRSSRTFAMRRAPALALSATLAFSGAYAQTLGPAPVATGGFSAPAAAAPPPVAAPLVPVSPIDPPAQQQGEAPKPKPKPKVAAAPITHERVVARSDKRPSVHPETAQALQEAIERYRGIAAAGGWPTLPEGTNLHAGSSGPLVAVLRQRLAAEGDFSGDTTSKTFDAPLVAAVKHFQGRHGQSQNGLVSGPTLKALRVSAQERLNALERSAQRYSAHTFAFGQRYIAVNLPSAAVEAIENGVVEKRFVAVVGKSERASPEVETRVTNVNLNPTWTVPVSLIKRDIIPHMRKDRGYLAKMKIRIYGASGNEIDPNAIDWNTERAAAFTLRQDPGVGNSLGQMRIDMPNTEAVYMHDTPSKRLFSRDDRFHSSGCVRVENVRDLAAWILEPTKGWDRAAIDAAIDTKERKDVRPREPVPVIWTYLTGFVTPDGQVHFRPDVYGYDSSTPVPAVARAPKRKAPVAAPVQPEPPPEAPTEDLASADPIQQLLGNR